MSCPRGQEIGDGFLFTQVVSSPRVLLAGAGVRKTISAETTDAFGDGICSTLRLRVYRFAPSVTASGSSRAHGVELGAQLGVGVWHVPRDFRSVAGREAALAAAAHFDERRHPARSCGIKLGVHDRPFPICGQYEWTRELGGGDRRYAAVPQHRARPDLQVDRTRYVVAGINLAVRNRGGVGRDRIRRDTGMQRLDDRRERRARRTCEPCATRPRLPSALIITLSASQPRNRFCAGTERKSRLALANSQYRR